MYTYPDINLRPDVAGALEHLRGSVWRGATPGGEVGVRTPEIGKSEIRYFYIHVLIEQEIFSFQVTMYNSPEMESSLNITGISSH